MNWFFLDEERQKLFETAVWKLKSAPVANPLFFSDQEITLLRQATMSLPFKKTRAVVGRGVHQDFDICFPAPLTGSFAQAAHMLEMACRQMRAKHEMLFESEIKINDFAVQRYPARSKGIGIHKDALRYRNLVFIITLAGNSQLFICSNRNGANRRTVADEPGRLVLLAAPGLCFLRHADDRPLHGVDQITTGRLSIGFRQDRSVSDGA